MVKISPSRQRQPPSTISTGKIVQAAHPQPTDMLCYAGGCCICLVHGSVLYMVCVVPGAIHGLHTGGSYVSLVHRRPLCMVGTRDSAI